VTTLVIDELLTSFSQPIRFKKRMVVASIKLHLYLHNLPAGNFSLIVEKEGNNYATFNFTSNSLRSSFGGTKNYFHIFAPFVFSSPAIFDRGDYVFRLTQTGYNYSTTSFLGWCKDFGGVFGGISDPNAEFTDYPYSFRIIERKPREL
jgi:hypothetical protein